MSQQTYITFFTSERIPNPSDVLQRILDLIDTSYNDVTRCTGIDESWNHRHDDYIDLDYDFLSRRVVRGEVPGLYEEGKLLSVSGGSKMQKSVRAAVEQHIPPEICGETRPQNTSVQIGQHDIFEDMEVGDGHLFGHATLSLSFWGYRHPPKIGSYREAIWQLAIIRSIKEDLSKIVGGAIECCVYMA